MAEHTQRLAVFPGSFDPLTNGHLDVIRRGAELFDELVVGLSANPEKAPLLSLADRSAILRQALRGLPNVRVETFRGLTVDFVRKAGAAVILRGIRNTSDLHAELQMAMTNRVVAGVETVFILTSPRYAFTSSTLIRQITRMGGDVSGLVPQEVLPYLRGKAKRKASDHTLHEPP
jgi:pantetheine-phosphate adenylyltransferase